MLAPLTPEDPPSIGTYRLYGRIGEGGMGVVYQAFAPDGRAVALKLPHREVASDAEFRARFRQEVNAARRVRGRFVAEVLDADVDASRPWMATDFIEGVSLGEAIGRRGVLDGGALTSLAAGLADALVDIHAAGVVHRDLKPSNILLSWDGPKVIDFGIAKAAGATRYTRTGERIGTAAWMAPEQLAGENAVPATDIFSWACCVAYAATGRHPFHAETVPALIGRILGGQPDLTDLPPAVAEVVRRSLAKQPSDRPLAQDVVASITRQPVRNAAEADAAATRLVGADAPAPAPVSPPSVMPRLRAPARPTEASAATRATVVPPSGTAPTTPTPTSAIPDVADVPGQRRSRPPLAVVGVLAVAAILLGLPLVVRSLGWAESWTDSSGYNRPAEDLWERLGSFGALFAVAPIATFLLVGAFLAGERITNVTEVLAGLSFGSTAAVLGISSVIHQQAFEDIEGNPPFGGLDTGWWLIVVGGLVGLSSLVGWRIAPNQWVRPGDAVPVYAGVLTVLAAAVLSVVPSSVSWRDSSVQPVILAVTIFIVVILGAMVARAWRRVGWPTLAMIAAAVALCVVFLFADGFIGYMFILLTVLLALPLFCHRYLDRAFLLTARFSIVPALLWLGIPWLVLAITDVLSAPRWYRRARPRQG